MPEPQVRLLLVLVPLEPIRFQYLIVRELWGMAGVWNVDDNTYERLGSYILDPMMEGGAFRHRVAGAVFDGFFPVRSVLPHLALKDIHNCWSVGVGMGRNSPTGL